MSYNRRCYIIGSKEPVDSYYLSHELGLKKAIATKVFKNMKEKEFIDLMNELLSDYKDRIGFTVVTMNDTIDYVIVWANSRDAICRVLEFLDIGYVW